MVAREAPGHEGRPDRGALGRPQRRERTEGAPPREADEGGNVPVGGDRHVRGREPVDADHDDATGGTAGVELHRNRRRGRRELRPEGQRHGERRRRGQDGERRRQRPVATREEDEVEADRQEDGRGTRHHDARRRRARAACRGAGRGGRRGGCASRARPRPPGPGTRARRRRGGPAITGRNGRGHQRTAVAAPATSERASVPPAAQGRKRHRTSAPTSRRSDRPGFR